MSLTPEPFPFKKQKSKSKPYVKLFIKAFLYTAVIVSASAFVKGALDEVESIKHENATLRAALEERTTERDNCRALSNVMVTLPKYKQVHLAGDMIVYFQGREVR